MLKLITAPVKLAEAKSEIVKAVQVELKRIGYDLTIDGIPGPKTTAAFHKFKTENFLGDLDTLGATTAAKLLGAKPELLISEYQIETIFGRQVTTQQLADLNNCCARFQINTPRRLQMFTSQIAHESGGGQWLCEIASGAAYEGRRDLGNTKPGFGRLYKGGGYLQVTGFYNYKKLAEYLNDERVLSEGCCYVATHLAATASGYWWMQNNMNSFIDQGANIEQVSARVNGKHPANGLLDRIKYYKLACKVIT